MGRRMNSHTFMHTLAPNCLCKHVLFRQGGNFCPWLRHLAVRVKVVYKAVQRSCISFVRDNGQYEMDHFIGVIMLAAERRYERAADQVVRCVKCEISEHLLTAET